jgi:hypothetical protein|tara:strand:- start:1330 stop:1848 length:519 start_codon:yes stop_codon:yes gene_type:complete
MNIFVLDYDPVKAAQAMDCVRVPKMVTESAQMMASALRYHGATDEQMPLTKSGTPYKGGYAHHPCTIWAGDSRANFIWLARHAIALCEEYTKRFGKHHACQDPIIDMYCICGLIPFTNSRVLTPFAQAMPDEYKNYDAVKAYRAYYHSKADSKGGVHYRHTSPPDWWMGVMA